MAILEAARHEEQVTPARVDRISLSSDDLLAQAGEGVGRYVLAARVADALLIAAAGCLAFITVGTVNWLPTGVAGAASWTVPIVLIWSVALELNGCYAMARIGDTAHDLRGVARTSIFLGAVVAIGAYLVNWDLSRILFGVTFGLGLPLLLFSHFMVRRALQNAHRRGLHMRRVIAVGSRQAVADLADELTRSNHVGLEVVAACVPEHEAWDPIGPVRWVLPVTSLHGAVQDISADYVFLLHGAGESPRHLRRIAWSLEGTGARLAVVPQLTDIAHGRIHARPVAGLPLIELQQPQLSGLQTVLKRAVDILGSVVALVLLSPVWALTALLIKREDGGPVLYRQVRVGAEEKEFCCFKFRSMHVDADRHLELLKSRDEGNGLLFKIRDDPRLTRVGRVIRKHSIDEIPQLINVLRGDMSLVGPRPPLPDEVAKYHTDLIRRLKVRPGMTGLWQVSGRSNLDAEESERLDLYYVDNWSIWHDLQILWKTLSVVVTGHGAY